MMELEKHLAAGAEPPVKVPMPPAPAARSTPPPDAAAPIEDARSRSGGWEPADLSAARSGWAQGFDPPSYIQGGSRPRTVLPLAAPPSVPYLPPDYPGMPSDPGAESSRVGFARMPSVTGEFGGQSSVVGPFAPVVTGSFLPVGPVTGRAPTYTGQIPYIVQPVMAAGGARRRAGRSRPRLRRRHSHRSRRWRLRRRLR
jgi:hypothetical protein